MNNIELTYCNKCTEMHVCTMTPSGVYLCEDCLKEYRDYLHNMHDELKRLFKDDRD